MEFVAPPQLSPPQLLRQFRCRRHSDPWLGHFVTPRLKSHLQRSLVRSFANFTVGSELVDFLIPFPLMRSHCHPHFGLILRFATLGLIHLAPPHQSFRHSMNWLDSSTQQSGSAPKPCSATSKSFIALVVATRSYCPIPNLKSPTPPRS